MSSQEIKAAVKRLSKKGGFDVAMDRAIVLSLDKNAVTCNVQLVADDLVLEDVKLKPIINEGDTSKMGLIVYPAVNSFVIVGQIDDDSADLFVLDTTVIESIALDTATALKLMVSKEGQLNLNAVKMVFNNGDNGGIPLLKPLVDAINALQKGHNDLLQAFKDHYHIGVKAGSDLSGITAVATPDQLTLTKTTDIENIDIQQ